MPYTDVFGGANIYPSDVSYSATALTADITLSWPEETSASANLAARIMDVTPDAAGLIITLPDADKSGTGNTILFNNKGSHDFTVKNAAGVQVVVVTPGTLWQVYLAVNTSAGGTWRAIAYGASSSIADASALAGTGLVAVGSELSQAVPVFNFNSNYTAGASDRAEMFLWTGAAGTLTLPDPGTVGANWFIELRNSGIGALTVDPSGAVQIDGSSTKIYNPGDSSTIVCDGLAYYTVGFGQASVFAFDYTAINVAGTGVYTLTGSELNRIAYGLTGVLTGDRQVVVPATVQQYWVTNNTTGAHTLTVKTAAGTGVTVNQGQSAIMYSDGTNVVLADTAGVSVPIGVADGGTGATTASGARVNLGATTVGNSLFTAVSASAARATLGSGTAGDAVFVSATQADARTALGAGAAGSAVFVSATQADGRTALGGTSVGGSVFTAANAAAARTALGSGAAGDAVFVAATQADGRAALGGTTVGGSLFTAADVAAAWTALGPVMGGEF